MQQNNYMPFFISLLYIMSFILFLKIINYGWSIISRNNRYSECIEPDLTISN